MTPTAVTVGTFDGVHMGHLHLLGRLEREARSRGLEPLAVTFARHPLSTLRPGAEPPMLAPRPPRLPLRACVLDFDRDMAAMDSRSFIAMLRERLGARLLVTGFNNRLGSDGPADAARYAAEGRAEGVEVITAEPLTLPGGTVPSSSAIRRALSEGDTVLAASMLGRPYSLEGVTAPGKQNGRRLGFPTLNLHTDPRRMLPATGVYAGRVHIGGDTDTYPAVINVGPNPPLGDSNPVTVEAHAIDAALPPDMYGVEATFSFGRRLRGERRFGSLDELRGAIAADIAAARAVSADGRRS